MEEKITISVKKEKIFVKRNVAMIKLEYLMKSEECLKQLEKIVKKEQIKRLYFFIPSRLKDISTEILGRLTAVNAAKQYGGHCSSIDAYNPYLNITNYLQIILDIFDYNDENDRIKNDEDLVLVISDLFDFDIEAKYLASLYEYNAKEYYSGKESYSIQLILENLLEE